MDVIPPRGASGAEPSPQPGQPPQPGGYPSHTASSGEPPKPRPNRLRPVLSFMGLLLTAFAIAFILNAFVIQSYQVDGESMETTLQNNDRLIVDKVPRTLARLTGHSYTPQRGQIIIFNENDLPGFIGTKQLIKRVIGLPGDHVVVDNQKITIYNAAHPNGFDPDHSGIYSFTPATTPVDIHVDVTLGPNQLFVCGDNRGNSEDSRYFGPIQTNQVVAKLVLRIMPINKAKTF